MLVLAPHARSEEEEGSNQEEVALILGREGKEVVILMIFSPGGRFLLARWPIARDSER